MIFRKSGDEVSTSVETKALIDERKVIIYNNYIYNNLKANGSAYKPFQKK